MKYPKPQLIQVGIVIFFNIQSNLICQENIILFSILD